MDSIMFGEDLAALLRQEGEFENCLSPQTNYSSTLINSPTSNSMEQILPPPVKLQKLNNFSIFSRQEHPDINVSTSVPVILNFGESNMDDINNISRSRPLNPDEEAAVSQVLLNNNTTTQDQAAVNHEVKQPAKKPSRVRPPSQTYDHIIAERKRREQLSQRFIALSSIVPGLKKMDKTSVLGDAIKYLKHLQERVKVLEEEATKQTMESVVLVRRSEIKTDDEDSSSEESGTNVNVEQSLPEIEARVCNNQILIRIHCEKQKGLLINLLSTVEKLNLSVLSSNVTPFGNLTIDITIVAEMEKEFKLTVKQVVKRLGAALKGM